MFSFIFLFRSRL